MASGACVCLRELMRTHVVLSDCFIHNSTSKRSGTLYHCISESITLRSGGTCVDITYSQRDIAFGPMIYDHTGKSCINSFHILDDELIKAHRSAASGGHASHELWSCSSMRSDSSAAPWHRSLLSRTRIVNDCIDAPLPTRGTISCLPAGALRRISVLGEGGYGAVRVTMLELVFALVVVWSELYEDFQPVQVSLCSYLTRAEHFLMAVKTPDKGREADVEREVYFYSLVDHPNVASCFGTLLYKGRVSLSLQYCAGGSLATLAQHYNYQIPYIYLLEIVEQVLAALEHLQDLGVCHMDIKPSNLLFDRLDDNAQVKLIDFGVSLADGLRTSFPVHGTLFFMAPELFSYGATASHANDIWSLGMTLRFICEGKVPGQLDDTEAFRSAVHGRRLHNDLGDLEVHDAVRGIMSMCLQYEPSKRPCASELRKHVAGLLHDHRSAKEAAAARREAEAAILNLPDTLGAFDSAACFNNEYAVYRGVRLPVTLDL